jgi:hippurate hydrolase
VNDGPAAETARNAGENVFAHVNTDPPQTMIVEDFAFMLEDRPGCYAWIGNGSDENNRFLHSAWYDFMTRLWPSALHISHAWSKCAEA